MLRVSCLVLAFATLLPQVLHAQDTPLSQVLVELIQADVRLAPPSQPGFPTHEAHFVPGEDQVLAPYLFNQAIVSQLSAYPVGSSSGGFTYNFDPALGTYARSSNTFGPSFAERALTIGKGRLNVGGNYQHASFNTFEGKDLEGGDIRFYLTHEDVAGDQFFEGDLVETALDVDITTDTFSMFANYGLTSRFDIGIVVPVAHVRLDATVVASVLRLATENITGIHQFVGEESRETIVESGSATGIGDILLRGKYHFLPRGAGGLAAAMDLRLPTGDEENLLGTGATQAKFYVIGSGAVSRLAPHFNIGYTFSGDSSNEFLNVTDEFNYVVGTEIYASERLTVNFDVIGRQLIDSGRLVDQTKTFNFRNVAGQQGSASFNEFALRDGNLSLATSAIGVKFNPMRNLLISANLLLPMTDGGIRSNPVPVIGIDYAF